MRLKEIIILLIFLSAFGLSQTEIKNAQKAEKMYKDAIEFLQLQQVEKAKELLKLALRYNPDSLKIHRLYQNIFPYREIIEYYQKQYENNKEKALWTYLYLRLVARENPEKGCKMIFEAEKKFPNHPYIQLAISTCEVASLNWSAAEITLQNLLKNKEAPVEAYENMLRLYSLENKTSMLLNICKEGLAKFPNEASIYRLCVGYSPDFIPMEEKKKFIEQAYKYFSNSHQLAEILFIYARSITEDEEKFPYIKMLWEKYPNNRISSSIFPLLWSQYSKENKNELEKLAKASFASDRVGDAFMYTTAASHLVEIWKEKPAEFDELLANIKVSPLNWQGILILLEKLIENKIYIKNMEALFPKLTEEIKNQKNIAKDYLFRAYMIQANYYQNVNNYQAAYLIYKLAKDYQEALFTEEIWLKYIDLLDKLSKKKEITESIAKCYVYSLNKECLKFKDKYTNAKELKNTISQIRKNLYPIPVQIKWQTFENKEISNKDFKDYNIFMILYAGSEICKKLIENNKADLEKVPENISIFLIILAEDQQKAQNFYQELNVKFPGIFSQEAAQKFQIKGIPSIVILDSRSYIIYNKYIDLEKNKEFKINNLINLIKIY